MSPALLLTLLPFSPGDWQQYRIAVGPAEVAQATVSFGLPEVAAKKTSPLLPVRGKVEPNALVKSFIRFGGELVTWLDAKTLAPKVTTFDRPTLKGQLHVRATQKQSGRIVVTPLSGNTVRLWSPTLEQRPSQPIYDPIAALLLLRSRALAPEKRLELAVLDGVRITRVTLVGGPVETLVLPLGQRKAQRVDGSAIRGGKLRRFSLWLTDDAERLPVRLTTETRFGPMVAEITAAGHDALANPKPSK